MFPGLKLTVYEVCIEYREYIGLNNVYLRVLAYSFDPVHQISSHLRGEGLGQALLCGRGLLLQT